MVVLIEQNVYFYFNADFLILKNENWIVLV
jgi:hypothetical protein